MTQGWTIESLARFFRVTDDADCHEGFWWRANEPQYEPFKILINCNDLFWWGCADCEAVTPETLGEFERAFADIQPLHDRWGNWIRENVRDAKRSMNDPECPPYIATSLALLLYCARVRKMRPQGAYYDAFPPEVAAMFDAAGPERGTKETGDTTRRTWTKGGSMGGSVNTTDDPPWKCRACHPDATGQSSGESTDG